MKSSISITRKASSDFSPLAIHGKPAKLPGPDLARNFMKLK